MQFKDISKKAKEIRKAYNEVNKRNNKKIWDAFDYGQGLVGDVGDLAKLLISFRDKPRKDTYKKIQHEVGDCLWSLVAIAQELGISLEKEFLVNVEYLEQKMKEKRKKNS
ncbi:MAG TPA: hypothetical protein VJJ72_01275 [Candidatus Paceibacterota bacterium]